MTFHLAPRPAARGLVIAGVVAGVSLLVAGRGLPERSVGSAGDGAGGSWPTVAGSWQESVVRVRTQRCDGAVSGTGVIFGGRVLTNVHVVEGATAVEVTTHDGEIHTVDRVRVSDRVDLADLDAAGVSGGLALAAPDTDRPFTMAGFPAGGSFDQRGVRVTGRLSGASFPDPVDALHLDAAVVGGESGSPLIDGNGRLAALLYARANTDGRGLAIASNDIVDELPRMSLLPPTTC